MTILKPDLTIRLLLLLLLNTEVAAPFIIYSLFSFHRHEEIIVIVEIFQFAKQKVGGAGIFHISEQLA
jgi:hypothetical protein